MSEDEFEVLILGCIRGDAKSQESLYKRLYGKMMAVCLRYTRDHDQAQDILQDGFIKVFGKLDRYNFEGSFEGWVRRIMVNTAIDFFRKKKTDFTLMGDNEKLEQYANVIEEEEDESDQEYDFEANDIVRAMQQLTPAYRTIFNLYVFENHTHLEIAEKLGINVGTSKSNFAKAKRNLKKILLNELKQRDGQ
jgi:RNA polymerase sigma-70 factor (ECF subfamily)